LNRIRSGVETPDANEGEFGDGGASDVWEAEGEVRDDEVVGERRRELEGLLEEDIVVLRVMFVVSVDGGGGRFVGKEEERVEARQRKHSPVPK